MREAGGGEQNDAQMLSSWTESRSVPGGEGEGERGCFPVFLLDLHPEVLVHLCLCESQAIVFFKVFQMIHSNGQLGLATSRSFRS